MATLTKMITILCIFTANENVLKGWFYQYQDSERYLGSQITGPHQQTVV